MRVKSIKADATPEELLALLAEIEHDLFRRGGVHRQRDRRDVMAAAIAAGCSLDSLARALGVNPGEVRAWEQVSVGRDAQ